MKLKVVYYETVRGSYPVREYIDSLTEGEQSKARALIDHLSEKRVLTEPQAKKMGGYSGLYELRPGKHRIFYCYQGGEIVLLHAYRKKSKKTPPREIDTAWRRMTVEESP